nr:NADH dehydrogenase [ubiquinone] 1 alpha subcomplex assembly factor 2 [Cavia porcellus]
MGALDEGQIIRDKRIIEAAKKNEISYEVGDIPIEWEGANHVPKLALISQCSFSLNPLNADITAMCHHVWLQHIFLNDGALKTEILKNEEYRQQMKIKSKDFYEKEKLLSQETNEELLPPPVQTQIKGHASAPYFGKEEPSATPTSTGKTFQPGSWVPQDGKSHNQ